MDGKIGAQPETERRKKERIIAYGNINTNYIHFNYLWLMPQFPQLWMSLEKIFVQIKM